MSVKLDTTRLDAILRDMKNNTDKIGRRMAFMVEAQAKARAPVDTGALRNSIYTATQKEDGYAQASAAARSSNAGAQTEAHPKPSGNIIAVVGPCVDYAEYQEFGTHKMAAQPYMMPAIEGVADDFENPANWQELFQ